MKQVVTGWITRIDARLGEIVLLFVLLSIPFVPVEVRLLRGRNFVLRVDVNGM